MAPFSMFLALQPHLAGAWGLTNTATGWISSAYFGGYMLSVPLLVSLTDREDARTVWLGSTALSCAAALGFGLFAEGVWSAALFQFIGGASLAGTYMPGLKVMADRIGATIHPRYVAFYTTSFTVGSSASFYAIGQLADWLPWRAAVAAAAAGPAAAWLLALVLLRPVAAHPHADGAAGHHWRTVARSSDALRYVVGYACHTWELFALRAWLVPFLSFCEATQGRAAFAAHASIAAIVSLVGVPASLVGAELTTMMERRRLIRTVMLMAAAFSAVCGWTASTSWTAIVAASILYNALISADSAALTSGLVAVSPPGSRGTAMALYSTAGFGAAWAGSFAIGALLDLLGGQSAMSWTVAFALMGAPNLIGVLALLGARR
jgi:MFS family permease